MDKALTNIKSRVLELRPYSLKVNQARVKLNQNENPWDAPLAIKQETLARFKDRAWSRYPDFVPTQLVTQLSVFSGWTAAGIVAGNGSNELIQALLMVTTGEGKRVLISEPTFTLYRQIATVLGGDILNVPMTRQLTFDAAALTNAIEEYKPAVTIICSPNNPTGCIIERNDLVLLLKAGNGLIVIDEAYFEFSGQSAVPLLAEHENLVVLRTFSKAMALAGLRVGYLLTAPQLAREISKAVLPYNLNVFSQTAAGVAIEMYEQTLRPLIERICAERDRLRTELASIPGITPLPSQANFFLVRSSVEPRRIFEELLVREILVRDVSSYPMLEDCFRISVGTPDENDALVRALREIMPGQ